MEPLKIVSTPVLAPLLFVQNATYGLTPDGLQVSFMIDSDEFSQPSACIVAYVLWLSSFIAAGEGIYNPQSLQTHLTSSLLLDGIGAQEGGVFSSEALE